MAASNTPGGITAAAGCEQQTRGHRGQLQKQPSVTSMSSGSGGGGSGYSSAERTLKIGVLGTKGVGKTGIFSMDGGIISIVL